VELLNVEDRDVGFWMVRLATCRADRTNNLARHKSWIERQLDAAVQRGTGKVNPKPVEEKSTPISLEQAKAKVELLKAAL
jgi:hypothetical protein